MKLAEPGGDVAKFHFRRGETYVWTARGWRRVAGLFGVWYRAKEAAHRLTRWWRPRTVCAAVDVEAGIVSMATERWSWRRWRWERR